MDTSFAVKDQLLATLRGLIDSVIGSIPLIVSALVLLVVALLLAKVVEKVLRVVLGRIRFDALLARPGIDQSLQRIGLRQPLGEVLPRVAYFLLLILFARAAADALGLVAVSEAIGSFLGFVPRLLAAILILLLGSIAGQFAGRAVAQGAESSGIEYGSSLGKLVSGTVMFVAVIMALGQMRIETEIVRLVTVCFLSGLALALALSFGLGSREISRNIIAGFYARKIFEPGQELEISGERGILKAITPTQTLLDRDGRTIAVANSVFLEEIVRQ